MKHVHENSKPLTLVNCNITVWTVNMLFNSLRASAQKMQPNLVAIVRLYELIRIGREIALENAFMIRVCVGERGAQPYMFFSKD